MRKRFNHTGHPQQFWFLGIASILFSLLVFRLFDLQVIKGEYYRAKADGNRFYTRYESAQRGVFFDRFGEPLVVNVPKYYKLTDRESLYSQRAPLTHAQALEEIVIEPDVVEFEIERHYLFPNATSHVLGYVSAVTAEELKKNPAIPLSAKTGKMGLERVFDAEVRGTAGSVTYEINALGKKQRTVEKRPGNPGKDLHTSLDPYLSEVAYRALGDQRGAVVILDADTGQVLSLVNTPSFDANVLSKTGITATEELQRRQTMSSYFTNPLNPFFDRAVSGVYPPGSVFKLITAVAGLEQGVLEETTTVKDEGVLDVGEYSYANWYYTQYGRVEGDINVVRSLARSNDIFFYKTAEWLGPIKLGEFANLFGFGLPTGIELPGEAAGLVPTPQWKEETIGEKWFLGNTFHMGIGQGDVLVSPLQVATSVQAFAKRGTLCSPRIMKVSDQNTETQCSGLGIREKNLELVVAGMLDACSSGGTAFPFFEHNEVTREVDLDPYEQIQKGAVACKTGTSEFGSANEEGYRKTHAWFATFFSFTTEMKNAAQQLENGVESPQEATQSAQLQPLEDSQIQSKKKTTAAEYSLSELYERWSEHVVKDGYAKNIVIVTLVESDEGEPFKEGSRDAAPVAKTIFDWMLGTLTVSE